MPDPRKEYAGDSFKANAVCQSGYVPRWQSWFLDIHSEMGVIMEKTKKCYLCEAKLDKDAIGLNKKLLDKSLARFLCVDCLATHLDISEEDLRVKISEFKDQGCTLFI